MDLNPGQLDALVAIADHGSFDAAARQLHITPSAVSQRIRALEAAAGQILISRGAPCRPTAHGEWLVRLGRQARFLYDEAGRALTAATAVELPVAVNADSLGSWFHDVLAEVASWDGTSIRLRVEDEAYSQELLRKGDVLAAVTSDPAAVQGCSADLLGALRYLPAAAPALAHRFRLGASPDWAALPVIDFNDKDDLQHRLLRRHGVEHGPLVVHHIPSSADFYKAVGLGLGWGLLPEPQARAALASGELVRLSDDVIDVPLHWQRWRLDSPQLAALTAAVRTAAARHLLRLAVSISAALFVRPAQSRSGCPAWDWPHFDGPRPGADQQRALQQSPFSRYGHRLQDEARLREGDSPTRSSGQARQETGRTKGDPG